MLVVLDCQVQRYIQDPNCDKALPMNALLGDQQAGIQVDQKGPCSVKKIGY
jgi:hypothetical protein